ncbi:MAG: hypothetical protein Q7R77_03670 [Candidatus Daviesbacteria bacterium]|nr:hypothetical protein [Candidatus Daviesbacteria bacterium]
MKNTERYEVAKFGGWSLANGERTKSAMDYVKANSDIHYVVPSAPGFVNKDDRKVTDHLIDLTEAKKLGNSYQDFLGAVNTRFMKIADFLGYHDMGRLLSELEEGVARGKTDAWIISRGEDINGRMWADFLDYCFVDPTELIKFRKDGQLDERSYHQIGSRLKRRDRYVIPGFFGLGADGEVQVFPRDGSDITAAYIARGIHASIYRNLTSTNGILSADPEIVKDARRIETMIFEEARELGNGGLKVLHRDAIIPCMQAGIDINVCCSEDPESPGTKIVVSRLSKANEGVIGIAGKAGFASLFFHKVGMEEDMGIASRILRAIKKNGIPISYIHTNTDDMSVIFSEQQLIGDREDKIKEEIGKLRPTEMVVKRGISVLSAVGQGLRENGSKVSAQLTTALNDVSIEHGITYISRSIIVRAFLEDSGRLNDAIKEAHKALIEDR